jgi:hypothetical protein
LSDIDTIPNTLNIQGALNIVGNPPLNYPEILLSVKDDNENQRMLMSKNGLFLAGRMHYGPVDVDGLYMIGAKNYLGGINSSASGYNVYNNSDSTQAFGNYLHTGDKNNSLLIGTGKSELQPLVLDRDNSVQIGANSATPNIILTEDTTRIYGLTLINDSTIPQLIDEYGGTEYINGLNEIDGVVGLGGYITSFPTIIGSEVANISFTTDHSIDQIKINGHSGEKLIVGNNAISLTSSLTGTYHNSLSIPNNGFINISTIDNDNNALYMYMDTSGIWLDSYEPDNWNDNYLTTVGWVNSAISNAGGAETDPIYTASQAFNIDAADVTNLGNLSGVNTGDQDISGIAVNQQAIKDTASQIRADMPDLSGYLTNETDPVYLASQAANIDAADVTNLGNLSGTNTGDQDLSAYLTSYSETDPVYTASQAFNIDANDITNLGNLSGTNTGDQDLSSLATKANVLELNNTSAFTPDADYEPATKKYVDDNAGTPISSEARIPFMNAGGTALTYEGVGALEWTGKVLKITDNNMYQNLVIGDGAGTQGSGSGNVVIGIDAAQDNTIGGGNVYIGRRAGQSTIGEGNVFIGNSAGSGETSVSDRLIIANNNTPAPLVEGYFASNKLEIHGQLSIESGVNTTSNPGSFVVSRMTTAVRDAYITPVNGMIIYNTTTNQFNFYENGAWVTK